MKKIDDRDTRAIFTALVNNTEVGIYVSNYQTYEILFVNRKMSEYVGLSQDEMIGQPCWRFVNPDKDARCPFCPHEKLLDGDGRPTEPYSWEFYIPQADMWIKSINQAIIWSDGRLAQMVTFYDITDTKKMQERLAILAFTDRLLQLKNELSLERDIREMSTKPSMLIFDIETLQKVNDAHGREAGDLLLVAIRDWIVEHSPENSELYRIGGDEFCLTIETHNDETLKCLADAISQRFVRPWVLDHGGQRVQIYCSITVAIIIGDYLLEDEPALSLIERTLKSAKNNKSTTVYDENMDKKYKESLQFELCLKKCVHGDMFGFDVHFQPITDPRSDIWCGLEALCRWNSPTAGNIPPDVFIAEAERLDLVGSIGLWVLERAIAKCKLWGLDRHRNFTLDINVSSAQFTDTKLGVKVLTILNKYDYPSDKLCLEITESTKFTFVAQSLNTINFLRENGVKVALDDFGTGYSNFHQMNNLPADIVKIERAFVKNIEDDGFQQYLFRAMSELIHTANMKLVAEGVESKEQMEILLKSGADYMQGYLFSRPLPADDLQKHLYRFEKASGI